MALLLSVVVASAQAQGLSVMARNKYTDCASISQGSSLHDFFTTNIWGTETVSFAQEKYKGKVTLVVNTASFWAYTPHYKSLNALTMIFRGQPFQILGFPCNQFAKQEPGANATEIFNCLKYVRPGGGFVPNFELFAKSDVNGEGEIPLYTFLKSRCPSVRKEFREEIEKLAYKPLRSEDIRWNFEKFLLNSNGQPVRRYDQELDPLEIRNDIDILIKRMRGSDYSYPYY